MRLIDADLLLRILEIDGRMSAEKAERYDYSNDELRKIISLAAFQHGKDMVEVVRCKDCVKKDKCMLYSEYRYPFFDEDFCSYGWDGEE